jgi:hypothetical protein
MITSAEHSSWPGDTAINLQELRKPCIIRMKFFTLDNRLILREIAKVPTPTRFHIRMFMSHFLDVY